MRGSGQQVLTVIQCQRTDKLQHTLTYCLHTHRLIMFTEQLTQAQSAEALTFKIPT